MNTSSNLNHVIRRCITKMYQIAEFIGLSYGHEGCFIMVNAPLILDVKKLISKYWCWKALLLKPLMTITFLLRFDKSGAERLFGGFCNQTMWPRWSSEVNFMDFITEVIYALFFKCIAALMEALITLWAKWSVIVRLLATIEANGDYSKFILSVNFGTVIVVVIPALHGSITMLQKYKGTSSMN